MLNKTTMKKTIIVICYILIISKALYTHSFFHVKKFHPNNKSLRVFSSGIKFFLDFHLDRFNKLSKVDNKYFKIFDKADQIDIKIDGDIKLKGKFLSVQIVIYQSGSSKIKIVEKFSNMAEILNKIFSKIKIYLGLKNNKIKISKVNFKSFKLFSNAVNLHYKNLDQKIRLILLALKLQPNSLEYLYYLALLYFRLNKYTNMENIINKILSISKRKKMFSISNKAKLLLARSYFYKINYSKASDILKKLSEFYNKNGKYIHYFKTSVFLAKIYAYLNKLKDSEAILNILQKREKLPYSEAIIKKHLGTLEYKKGNYIKAKSLFENSLTYFNKAGWKYEKATVYAAIASVQIMLQKYKQAGLTINKIKLKTNKVLYIKNYLLGQIFYEQEKFNKALKYYHVAFKHSQKDKYFFGVVKSKFQLGKCYFFLKNYKKALNHFDSILSYIRGTLLDELYGWALFYNHLCYYKMNNKRRSISYLKRSIDILGFIRHPALKLLKKRLNDIENNKKPKKIFHRPNEITNKKSNEKESRREEALKNSNAEKPAISK